MRLAPGFWKVLLIFDFKIFWQLLLQVWKKSDKPQKDVKSFQNASLKDLTKLAKNNAAG